MNILDSSVVEAGNHIFRQRAAKEIMSAQNFNFALKCSQNEGFPTPIFVFLEKSFDNKKICQQPASLPFTSTTMPLAL